MNKTHPDIDSYDVIWNKVISKEIKNYQEAYKNCIELIPNIKEEIRERYISLNHYCKATYMKSFDGEIDRHKIAACYMIAIVMSRPMKFVGKIKNQEEPIAINEMLAITVGLSIVRGLALGVIMMDSHLDKKTTNELVAKFEDGIKLPTGVLVNHGVYLNNYANELYYAYTERKLCILSLAHELYLLEVITMIS